MVQPYIAAIGLGLGVLGAALIAIPDIRLIFSNFPAGALKEARDRMTLIGIQEGDVGFESLRELLNEIEPVAAFGENHGGEKYVEIGVNSLSGLQTSETHNHPDFDWGNRYVEARYVRNGGWDETDFYNVKDIFDTIASKERPQTASFRIFGLILLICGFAFQLFATL